MQTSTEYSRTSSSTTRRCPALMAPTGLVRRHHRPSPPPTSYRPASGTHRRLSLIRRRQPGRRPRRPATSWTTCCRRRQPADNIQAPPTSTVGYRTPPTTGNHRDLVTFFLFITHADGSRGESKAFGGVCLSVRTIKPKRLNLKSPNLAQG